MGALVRHNLRISSNNDMPREATPTLTNLKEIAMLTDAQNKVLELSKQMEGLKDQLKETGTQLEAALTELGVGEHFQDTADNVVFRVCVPKGRYVAFPTIGYDRTKRDGERQGSLSMKDAKELGYGL